MSTPQALLQHATQQLQEAGVDSPALDARLLLEHALGLSREALLLRMDEPLTDAQCARYEALVLRRAAREPVAHIVGVREFWGMDFKVTAATLVPRPDSETVIEAVLARLPDREKPYKILDLGTGSGCLLLSLLKELPGATATGVDSSEAAIGVAEENAMRFGMRPRAGFIRSDWCEKLTGTFDIIVANPPYIPSGDIATLTDEVGKFEPLRALDGGGDGLESYRAIMAALPRVLAAGGFAAFEVGIGQAQAVANLAKAQGFALAEVRKDLGGIERCVVVTGA